MVANINEHARVRRRIERDFQSINQSFYPDWSKLPVSVEQAAYNEDAYGQRKQPGPKEIPLYFVGVFAGAFWTAFVALVLLAWWAVKQ